MKHTPNYNASLKVMAMLFIDSIALEQEKTELEKLKIQVQESRKKIRAILKKYGR